LRGASQITTVSGDTRAWFSNLFGDEFSKKLRTIPGGIDIDLFPKKFSTKEIEKKYKLEGKKIVLFAGRLTPQKGVKYLVLAAKKILGEVFIIGDGPERKALIELAKKLKIKNIHFLGYFGRKRTREFKQFYYAADVFVAPSVWQEPLGLVILEAMACQTPVVVTRKGGIPLAVKEKVNGFFVRPRNANDIAEKVNKILTNEKLAKKLGENARKIVKEKFTWGKIAKRFKYIYQKHSGNFKK
jgi:glycosyltransferase involved in cell wall biosynthesis